MARPSINKGSASACALLFLAGCAATSALNHLTIGNKLRDQGRDEDALVEYGKALELYPMYGQAYYYRGSIYFRRGQYEKALPDFTKTIELKPGWPLFESDFLFGAYVSRADVYHFTRRYEQAIADLKQALDIRPNAGAAYDHLGWLYFILGQYADAEPMYKHALTINERDLGRANPRVAGTLLNIGLLYQALGDLNKAESFLERSLAVTPKASNPTDINFHALGILYKEQNRHAEAEEAFKRSVGIFGKTQSVFGLDATVHMYELGWYYTAQGKYIDAEPLVRVAVASAERVLGRGHPVVGTMTKDYVALLRKIGREAEAGNFEAWVKANQTKPVQNKSSEKPGEEIPK